MRIPSCTMLILRCVVTLQLSAVIGQAGWAAAALGRGERIPLARGAGSYDPQPVAHGGDAELGGLLLDRTYLSLHSTFAVVTLLICVLSAALYVAWRRQAGPVNLGLALATLLATAVQYLLGEVQAVDVHIFLGVLIAMLTTALTSWTYRHDDGGPPAFTPRGARGE